MSDSLGFDVKCLSDDELYNKQVELTRKKTQALRLMRADTVGQLDVLIQTIEYERRERMFLDRMKHVPSSSVVLETDPSLREVEKEIEDEIKIASDKPVRPVRRAIRTRTPVIPSEGNE